MPTWAMRHRACGRRRESFRSRRPGQVWHDRPGQNALGIRGGARYPGGLAAHGWDLLGKGAMAGTFARRHLHRARELELLRADRHMHRALHRPLVGHLARRPPLSAILVAALALAIGWVSSAVAAPLMRVAIVEGVRTVEIGGGPMVVTDLADRALDGESPTWLRATLKDGAIEIRGR